MMNIAPDINNHLRSIGLFISMIMWNNRSKVRDDLTPPCPRHPFSVFSNFSVFSDFFVLDIDIKIGTLVPTAKLDPIG